MITTTQQNQMFGSANGNLSTESPSGVVPGSSGVQAVDQSANKTNPTRKDFSKHIESDSDETAKRQSRLEEKKSGAKSTSKTSSKILSKEQAEQTEQTGPAGSVAHQVLKQLVKQNPAAKPPALIFLESQPQPALQDELPQLMASSRFIADALMDRDLSGFLDQSAKPSQVMMELDFGPEIIVQAMAMGVDGSGAMQRGQILDAMGVDPKNIEAGLSQLKDSIMAGGLTGYMQQSLALTRASGRSPDLIDEITGEFARDTRLGDAESDAGDLNWMNRTEMHAFMTQAMSFSAGQFSMPVAGAQNIVMSGSPEIETLSDNLELHGKNVAAIGALEASDSLKDVRAVSLESLRDALDFTDFNGISLNQSSQMNAPQGKVTLLDVTQFQVKLGEEFDSDIRVIAVGESAWESSPAESWIGVEIDSLNSEALASFDVVAKSGLDEAVLPSIPEINTLKDQGDRRDGAGQQDQKSDFTEEPRQLEQREPTNSDPARNFMSGESFVPESDLQTEASVREKLDVGGRHAADVVRKIQDAARHTSVSNIGAMRLDLSSSETGQLEVMVRLDSDQQVDVRLIAGSEEMKDLIVRELSQLRNTLSEQSLNLRNFETRVVQDSTSQMLAQGGGQGGFFGDGREGRAGTQQGQSGGDGRASASLANVNQQIGRRALRSFRVLDLTDRSFAGTGRIKVLA